MEKGVMKGEERSESTTTFNRSDFEEEEIRKGLKVEFEDQVAFYEEFGLTSSESESLARAGFFLVPFDITEERCKLVMNNMQAVRLHDLFSHFFSYTAKNNSTKQQNRDPPKLPKLLRPNRAGIKRGDDGYCAQLTKDLHNEFRRYLYKKRKKQDKDYKSSSSSKQFL